MGGGGGGATSGLDCEEAVLSLEPLTLKSTKADTSDFSSTVTKIGSPTFTSLPAVTRIFAT